MPEHTTSLLDQLRAYGERLDAAAGAAAPAERLGAADVAELVPSPTSRDRRRLLLAAAALVAVLAVAMGVLATRDGDQRSHVTTNEHPTRPSIVTTTPKPTTTTIARRVVSAPPRDVLVASHDGLVRLRTDGTRDRLVDGPVAVGFPDGSGGAVFQRSLDHRTIWHLAAGASTPTALINAGATQALTLHDVEDVEGRWSVFYTREDNASTYNPVDTLRRYDFATRRATSMARTGGWEFGSNPISVGGSLVALETQSDASWSFKFVDLNGNALIIPGNPFDDRHRYPTGSCPDDPTCPVALGISPDGTHYAYTEEPGGPGYARLVVVDARNGETREIDLPVTDELNSTDVDLGSDVAIVNRVTYDNNGNRQPMAPLIVDLRTGHVTTIPVAGDTHPA